MSLLKKILVHLTCISLSRRILSRLVQVSYSYSSVVFVYRPPRHTVLALPGSSYQRVYLSHPLLTPRLSFAASYNSTSPFFNTPLAMPITLSAWAISPLLASPAANPLPVLTEGDSSSLRSHANVALKRWARLQSDTSLHPDQVLLYIYMCVYIRSVAIIVWASSPFLPCLLFLLLGVRKQPGARSSLQIVREAQKKKWRLDAPSSLWLRMWVRQQYVLTLS